MTVPTDLDAGRPGRPRGRARARAAGERRSLAGMAAVVVLLNVVGWGVLLLAVVPQGLSAGGTVFGAGLGVTAFLLGVRHAVDADHIAAIDNTTRRLVGNGRPALSAGFWFGLGHSSVVFGLSLLLASGVRAVAGPVADPGSAARESFALLGGAAAGTVLLLVGLLNLRSVVGLLGVRRSARGGAELDEQELERHLARRGLAARALGAVSARVTAPWQMYPVGLLMGLGLDTATQVALLVVAGGTAAVAVPWYAVLVLPVLFAAGMTLCDAADGVVMARAYRWAVVDPGRRAAYNLVVTLVSVVAALGFGTVVLVRLLVERVDVPGVVLAWVAGADLEHAGLALVLLLCAVRLAGAIHLRRRHVPAPLTGRITDRVTGRVTGR